jgi:hypothetical protein
LCIAGERGKGVGGEPNHMTARKAGPLKDMVFRVRIALKMFIERIFIVC